MRNIKVLLAGLIILSPIVASADLIDRGDTTFDTASGLEWLDLTHTLGQSYNSIVGGFGGYIAAGYRYATRDEVCDLFGALGDTLECLDGTAETIQQTSADTLVELLGNTRSGFSTSIGLFDSGHIDTTLQVGIGCVTNGPAICSPAPSTFLRSAAWSIVGARSDFGSYLVRTTSVTVPEPGTLALLSLGLAGLGLARRRRH